MTSREKYSSERAEEKLDRQLDDYFVQGKKNDRNKKKGKPKKSEE